METVFEGNSPISYIPSVRIDSTIEIWKPVPDFPNYHVSDHGTVMNVQTNKLLRLTDKCGYLRIGFKNKMMKKSWYIHRLVASVFIENPENKSDVNHKDKNKQNNHVSNLEWNTRKENNIHRCIGITITTNKNKPIFRCDVSTGENLEKYESIELAGIWACNNEYTKTSHTGRNSIGNCIQKRSKSAYGFSWKLENTNEDVEGEIWKQVLLENMDEKIYFVSNYGRFKNSFGIIMDNYKITGGYLRTYIYGKTYRIHRLVALAFIPNPENKEQVNHIDGNKLNNRLDNLEWMTNQENQIHKFQIGLGNNFTRKITQYDLHMNKIKDFDSIAGACKELNIGKSNIRGVLMKHRKTAGGFIFKYCD